MNRNAYLVNAWLEQLQARYNITRVFVSDEGYKALAASCADAPYIRDTFAIGSVTFYRTTGLKDRQALVQHVSGAEMEQLPQEIFG